MLDKAAFPILWGDLEPVPWIQLRLFNESDLYGSVVAQLVAAVTPYDQKVCGERFHVSPPQQYFSCAFSIDRHHLTHTSTVEGVVDLLRQHLLHTGHQMAPFLYAHDPRIGKVWGRDVPCLQKSPLFDPPGMRTPYYEPDRTSLCPLCQKPMTFSNPAMWAGGAIHWVHEDCWMQGARNRVVEESFSRIWEHAPLDISSLRSPGYSRPGRTPAWPA